MTQSALAKKSGVSQSTIAKIERGRVRGNYHDVVKLFEALEDEAERKSARTKLRDVSTKKLICVQVDDQVKKAADLMKEKDISHLPVFDGDRSVGSISEKCILDVIMFGVSAEEVGRRPVRSLMNGPFPLIDEDVDKESVEPLILAEHAVLTTKNGKITGIVTGADLLVLDWVI